MYESDQTLKSYKHAWFKEMYIIESDNDMLPYQPCTIN